MSRKARDRIDTRVVGSKDLTLPTRFEGYMCYACPTNVERSAISASSFQKHLLDTHPQVDSNELPLLHTIIVEADIQSSPSKRAKIRVINVLQHRILTTCGDSHAVVANSKKIDPALSLNVGAYFVCVIDKKYLTEKVPRGNGTLCRVNSIKLKNNPCTYR